MAEGRARTDGLSITRAESNRRSRISKISKARWSSSHSTLWDASSSLGDEEFRPDIVELRTFAELSRTGEDVEPEAKSNMRSFGSLIRQVTSTKKETPFMAFGQKASAASGVGYSLQAFVYAKLIVLFANPSKPRFSKEVGLYCGFFLVIGVVAFFAH